MSNKIKFNFLKTLKITMPIVYMTLGIVLLCFSGILDSVTGNIRIAFSVMLIVYGGLRFYQTYFKKEEDEK